MRENGSFSHNGISRIFTCCAVVAVLVGLAGCSVDKTKDTASNPNGITAPAPETPQNTLFSVTGNRKSLILGGVSSQTGAPDILCGLDITVKDTQYSFLVDADVEIRWNDSDYPNRTIFCNGSGVTGSHSNGVWHLHATTDANGTAHFRVAGSYTGSLSCGGGEGDAGNPRKGRVFVDGVEQTLSGGWFNVSTADYNQTGGVNVADLSQVLADDTCANYYSRSDLDGDGDVDDDDYEIVEAIYFGGGSPTNCNE